MPHASPLPHPDVSPPRTPPTPATFKSRLSSFAYTEPNPPPTHRQPTPTRRSPRNTSTSLKRAHSPTRTPITRTPTTRTPTKRPRHPSPTTPLPLLPDTLAPNLLLLFVGLNPGLTTSATGHPYAHPSNRFYPLLHSSRITPTRLRPSQSHTLPAYAVGTTNLCPRPTRNGAALTSAELSAGAHVLLEKIARWQPEAVALVGKGVWEAVWRATRGRGMEREEFTWGWQEGVRLGGARVFVATSTSGLAASLSGAEKEAIWRPLGEWVRRRRRERGEVVEGDGSGEEEEEEDGAGGDEDAVEE